MVRAVSVAIASVPAMTTVHEKVHHDAEREECNKEPVTGEYVETVLVGEQQAGHRKECDQDSAGS